MAVPGPTVKPDGVETTMFVNGVKPLTPSRKLAFETVRLPTASGLRKNVLLSSSEPEFVTNIPFVADTMLLDTLNVPPLTVMRGLLGIAPEPTSDNKPPATIVLLWYVLLPVMIHVPALVLMSV